MQTSKLFRVAGAGIFIVLSFVAAMANELTLQIEPRAGSTSRLLVSTKAMSRLGIQTARVQVVEITPTTTVAGEVILVQPAGIAYGAGETENALQSFWVKFHLDDLKFNVNPVAGITLTTLGIGKPVQEMIGLPLTGAAQYDSSGARLLEVGAGNRGLVAGERVLVTLSGLGSIRKAVPYASVLYDELGREWVYVSSEPGVFFRELVIIENIKAPRGLAVLSSGPPVNTTIVSLGGSELYGAETGVGH